MNMHTEAETLAAHEKQLRRHRRYIAILFAGTLAYTGLNEFLLIPRQVRAEIEGRRPEIQAAVDGILLSYKEAQADAASLRTLLVSLQASPVPKYVAIPFFGSIDALNTSGQGRWIQLDGSSIPTGFPELLRLFPSGKFPDLRGGVPVGLAAGQVVGESVGSDTVSLKNLTASGISDGVDDVIASKANEILAGRYDSGFFLQDTPGDESRAARAKVAISFQNTQVPYTPKGVAVNWVMRVAP